MGIVIRHKGSTMGCPMGAHGMSDESHGNSRLGNSIGNPEGSPVGRRMSYRGSPIGFRASPMGSPGFPRKFSGPHGKSHCTVVVHTSIQQPFYEFDLIVEYSVKMELIYSTTIVIHLA